VRQQQGGGDDPDHRRNQPDTVVAVVDREPTPCLHAGPLQPVIEGLLAKNPADRLDEERAGVALLDLQQPLRGCNPTVVGLS
jgi:hypothetical protein